MQPQLIRVFCTGALLCLALVGCAPQIGDGCAGSTNCSINGDRLCDLTQPGGACIVYDCEPNQCPDNAVCVRFNPEPQRLSVTACMRRCGSDSDCRGEYRCVSTAELDNGLTALVTDTDPNRRFCVARDP